MKSPSSDGYEALVKRLNRFPQGVPPSESLYHILGLLFSEREAALVARLPIKPFRAETASRLWDLDLATTRDILQGLAGRALLLDVEQDGHSLYTVPPPMAGFLEFSMMRVRDDVDQQVLGELLYRYCNEEEAFVKELFADTGTPLGRVFVHEPVLPPEAQILDYERASEVIRTASHRGVSNCYCRFKMEQVERACEAPLDICLTFNNAAESLTKHGFAREVDVAEGLDILARAYEHNLVQIGENSRQGVAFICNCCSCCCEALVAARRFEMLRPMQTTNFLPEIQAADCKGCGLCARHCPMDAITLVESEAGGHTTKCAVVDEELCLGCGVCARVCPTRGVVMREREERVVTPYNSTHRVVRLAIEKGMLHQLIFDRQVLWSHRALANVLQALLALPPIERALAGEQVKSRYLEALIARFQ
ncbi:MAG: 4Fe-4S dicluster domain-containing protein [Anaerolineales bacterium]